MRVQPDKQTKCVASYLGHIMHRLCFRLFGNARGIFVSKALGVAALEMDLAGGNLLPRVEAITAPCPSDDPQFVVGRVMSYMHIEVLQLELCGLKLSKSSN